MEKAVGLGVARIGIMPDSYELDSTKYKIFSLTAALYDELSQCYVGLKPA